MGRDIQKKVREQYTTYGNLVGKWLLKTAKDNGYDVSSLAGASKKDYEIGIDDYCPLSTFVSSLPEDRLEENGSVEEVARMLNLAIEGRKYLAEFYSATAERRAAFSAEILRHQYPIQVFETVKGLLQDKFQILIEKNRLAKLGLSPSVGIASANPFAALEGNEGEDNEGEEDDGHAEIDFNDKHFSGISIRNEIEESAAAAAEAAKYARARLADIREAMFDDLADIRRYIRSTWQQYADNKIDLITASMVINTALRVTSALSNRFEQECPNQQQVKNNIMGSYYSDLCRRRSGRQDLGILKPRIRLLPHDRLNFAAYPEADKALATVLSILKEYLIMTRGATQVVYMEDRSQYFTLEDDLDIMNSEDEERQEFAKKRKFLLEVLPDFVALQKGTNKDSGEDEVTRAIRECIRTGLITVQAAMAAETLYQAHEVLQGKTELVFDLCYRVVVYTGDSIEDSFDLAEEDGKVPGDELRRSFEKEKSFKETYRTTAPWFLRDPVGDALASMGAEKKREADGASYLLRRHPLFCGTAMLGLLRRYQDFSLEFVNIYGVVKATAFLYAIGKAERPELLRADWPDLAFAKNHNAFEDFIKGDKLHEKQLKLIINEFCSTMGWPLLGSTAGHLTAVEDAPCLVVSNELTKFFLQTLTTDTVQDQPLMALSEVEEILNWIHAKVEHEEHERAPETLLGPGETTTDPSGSDWSVWPRLSAVLSGILRELPRELVTMSFDYLTLHRSCEETLYGVNAQVSKQLTRTFGPQFLKARQELPKLVGYILMAASDEVHGNGAQLKDKLLHDAMPKILEMAWKSLEDCIQKESAMGIDCVFGYQTLKYSEKFLTLLTDKDALDEDNALLRNVRKAREQIWATMHEAFGKM